MFRFCFALMVFGLLRILVLTGVGMLEAYRRNPDKILPWADLTRKTLSWMIPLGAIWRKRPIYSSVSILFHIGLISVPLFLAAHVLLWKGALGFAWPSIPQPAADWLTILVIVTALGLFAGLVAFHPGSRTLSRKQDYMWPLLLLVPFATGYVCSNAVIGPEMYERMMLVHVYAANLIMLLIPFTKIAHCILMPLSQYVTGLAWKFPAGAGNRVAETLGYADRPTWVERPRLATDKTVAPMERPDMHAAILTDTTKCIGCRECVLACKKTNDLPPDLPRRWTLGDGLSARNWTSIIDRPEGKYVRKQCRHCLEPACASACPVGALEKTELGPVVYDADKCMGCRYCMMACPYGIPRYDWDQTVPYIRKCVLCYETRLKDGREPACTESCPTQATIFGDRDELIKIAHQRIDAEPDKYEGKVWGEHEVGGASILYISDVDLGFLTNNANLGPEPMPEKTKLAMNAVPFAFVGMVSAMAGVNWIIGRRDKLKEHPESAGREGTSNE